MLFPNAIWQVSFRKFLWNSEKCFQNLINFILSFQFCFVHTEHFQIYPLANRPFVQLVYKETLCKILGHGAAQHCSRAIILTYPCKLMNLFWLIPVKITCGNTHNRFPTQHISFLSAQYTAPFTEPSNGLHQRKWRQSVTYSRIRQVKPKF